MALSIVFMPRINAQSKALNIEAGAAFTLSMFQQQVKPEIGDERGERLTYDYGIGLDMWSYYRINEYLAIGAFLRYDIGRNQAASLDSISADGKAVTQGNIEGDFSEIWVGPRIWIGYEGLFSEFGWGIYGTRFDGSRSDIPDENGDSSSNLDLNPSVAMLLTFGYETEIAPDLFILGKLEWRIRYYDGREGIPLSGNIEHGTMNISPFLGFRYAW